MGVTFLFQSITAMPEYRELSIEVRLQRGCHLLPPKPICDVLHSNIIFP